MPHRPSLHPHLAAQSYGRRVRLDSENNTTLICHVLPFEMHHTAI